VELSAPKPGRRYLLYIHVPFCESLCPYCSFNRFPFARERAVPYFEHMRDELRMLADRGFSFEEVYVGGGTPTIMMDELAKTISLARELFPQIRDASIETNPNHLLEEYLAPIGGLVQRVSVGVQSFDDGMLAQMGRLEKYGHAEQILSRIQGICGSGLFHSLNVDMIFNLPTQTPQMLAHDIDCAKASGANQVTFYPLMVSPVSRASIEATMGHVDQSAEEALYHQVFDAFCAGDEAEFVPSSCYTFSREKGQMIDEYVVNYEEYVAVGSGGMSYLDGRLFVNTFSLSDYERRIEGGRTSTMGRIEFSKRDEMRYRFMMDLFGLRLDRLAWRNRFGHDVKRGLPAEYAFMKASGAFARNTDEELTLTSKGRYLMVAMMRQFFIGVNGLRDQARAALPGDEHALIFGR
jgi:coproporphyrinogen III oxidase-like Fe-S oxidoreductase